MLLRCIKGENRKLSHSHIFIISLFVPLIPAVMGTFNYLNNLELLKEGWYNLWTQHTLFYSNFFYGPLIGIYASYLWRLEHLNHNWNMIMTAPVPVSHIFFGKLFVIVKITFFTQLWVLFLFYIGGKASGLSGVMPPAIVVWLLRGTLAGFAIGALQLMLSMTIRSFSIPIGIAFLGGIGGMLFGSRGLGMYWPYSLMMLGMNANQTEDVLTGGIGPFLISVAVYMVLFAGIAVKILKIKDVRS